MQFEKHFRNFDFGFGSEKTVGTGNLGNSVKIKSKSVKKAEQKRIAFGTAKAVLTAFLVIFGLSAKNKNSRKR